MLIESDLACGYWGFAVKYSTLILNCTPTAALNGCTPHEQWYGCPPNVDVHHPFGCLAYQKVPKKQHKKFQPKGECCIFLGIPDGYAGYLILHLCDNRLLVSQDVQFNDKVFPKQHDKTLELDGDDEGYDASFLTSGHNKTPAALDAVDSDESSDEDNENPFIPPMPAPNPVVQPSPPPALRNPFMNPSPHLSPDSLMPLTPHTPISTPPGFPIGPVLNQPNVAPSPHVFAPPGHTPRLSAFDQSVQELKENPRRRRAFEASGKANLIVDATESEDVDYLYVQQVLDDTPTSF